MRQKGKVVSVREDMKTAFVTLETEKSCVGCKGCSGFGSGCDLIFSNNKIGAKVNDEVLIDINGWSRTWSGVLVFFLPLILFFTGFIVLNQSMRLNQGVSRLGGFGFIGVYFTVLHYLDKTRIKKGKCSVEIVSVFMSRQLI